MRGGSAWAWAWQAKNSLYGQHAGRWATHISDSSLLVDLSLEVLENALVNHVVGCGGCSAGKALSEGILVLRCGNGDANFSYVKNLRLTTTITVVDSDLNAFKVKVRILRTK